MLNPISAAFIKAKQENRPALLTYTVAGDSSKKQSLNILKSISKNADILEVGVPHNTPVADGSQIQTSAYRAIKNGIKVNDIFKIVKDFKKFDKNKPVILMGYYNMIFQYGENKFLNKCKLSGVNGLIVVDLPWPENKDFAKKCKKKSIYFIQLLSPTTTKIRLKKIIKDSHPMSYFISMLSTTGGKLKVSPKDILKNYTKIKKIDPKKEIVIGFGITEKTIGKLKSADGLVVGSAICKEISKSLKHRQNPVINVSKLVKKLKKLNPELLIEINGGLTNIDESLKALNDFDGVMIGRSIYKHPLRWSEIDQKIYGINKKSKSASSIIFSLIPYIEGHLSNGGKSWDICKHLINLVEGIPKAKIWRNQISNKSLKKELNIEYLFKLTKALEEMGY